MKHTRRTHDERPSTNNEYDRFRTGIACLTEGYALRVAAKPAPQPQVNTFVDVTSFGAKGDGVTDDTASILEAIAAAPVGSVLFFFPKGNYLVTDELLITKRISVTGAVLGLIDPSNDNPVLDARLRGHDV